MDNGSSSKHQNHNVPKLRFPGFEGTEYKHETVGTLFKHSSKRNADGRYKNVITNSAEHGLIPQRDFFDKDIAVEGNTQNYYIIQKGDFVYNPRKSTTAPYGPFNCYMYDNEGIVSPLYTCLTPKYKEYTKYLLWYFKSSAWYSYIYHNGAQGGARHDRVGMTNELMDGIPINLPSIQEQHKVSSFLSLLDDRITKQRELVEKLKTYKRGALSVMFPQKGETVPRCRFASFSGDWEKRKLGDLVLIERGGSPRPIDDYITDSPDGLNWVKIGDAPEQGQYITKTAEKIKPEGLSKTRQVQPGDLILSNSMSFGKPYIMGINGCIHDGWLLIRNTHSCFDLKFLCHMLGTDQMIDQYKMFAAGSTVNNLNKELVGSTVVSLPSITEQKVIGEYLESIDHLISLHQNKLDMLMKIKQSLLQQLFI